MQCRILIELPREDVLAGQPRAGLGKLRELLAHAVRRPARDVLATHTAINGFVDGRIQWPTLEAHTSADLVEEIGAQALLPAHGAERLLKQVTQGIESGATAQLDADGAEAKRTQALPSRQNLLRVVQVIDDFRDALLRERYVVEEALLAHLELGERGTVKIVCALIQGWESAGQEGPVHRLREQGDVARDAKSAKGLAEQRPLVDAKVLTQPLRIAHDVVLAQ